MEKYNMPTNIAPGIVIDDSSKQQKTNTILIAIIALIIGLIAGGAVIYFVNPRKTTSTTDTQVTPTPTAMNQPTKTPTPSPTATQAILPSQTVKPTTVTQKTYTDNEAKFSFTYPSSFTIKAGKFNVQTDSGFKSKSIEVIRNANTKMLFEYSTSPTGCVQPNNYKVETVFPLTSLPTYYIGREKSLDQNGKVIGHNYGKYSAAKNGDGNLCDLTSFANNYDKGYFFVRIETNNVNQDFTDFDDIVKSVKRL